MCGLTAKSTNQKMQNSETGEFPRSRDLLLNIGTLCLSRERLKLRTSNLVCRLTTMNTVEKVQN